MRTKSNTKQREKVFFWPAWFTENLSPARRKKLPPHLIQDLAQANHELWKAFNIYDDFLDNCGEPSLLPSANTSYRRCLKIYYQLGLGQEFYAILDQIFDDLDLANRTEVIKRRQFEVKGMVAINDYPSSDLISLCRKSLALALGPLAILYHLNDPRSQRRIPGILQFFRCALAAKQLADDARDWQEDLEAGHLTIATLMIIKSARRKKISLHPSIDKETSCRLFISVSHRLSTLIAKLCKQARQTGTTCGLSPDSRLVSEILGPMEGGLKEAAAFRSWLNADAR